MTGGRIKRIQPYIGNETFLMTYGDGVSDININELVKYHRANSDVATITAAKIDQRFGVLNISENKITSFREKSSIDGGRINAGYMVLEPKIFDYIKDDTTVFEKEPLETLANNGLLTAYLFDGYWQCMDTKREMDLLNKLWNENKAPWKIWKD